MEEEMEFVSLLWNQLCSVTSPRSRCPVRTSDQRYRRVGVSVILWIILVSTLQAIEENVQPRAHVHLPPEGFGLL